MPLRDFVEETDEMWDSMMGINGKGTATSMRQAIKQFLKQPVDAKSGSRGRIVNISSSAGIVAIRREATYAASKAAVSMLTRNVALDHAKDYVKTKKFLTFSSSPRSEYLQLTFIVFVRSILTLCVP